MAGRLARDPAKPRLEKVICLQLRGEFRAAGRELSRLQPDDIDDPAVRARVLNAAGANQFNSSQSDAAMRLHEQALTLAEKPGDQRLQAESLIHLARVSYHLRGEADRALSLLHRALGLARAAGDERLEADALRNAGATVWWWKEDYETALRDYYEPALRIYQRTGDLHGAGVTLSNISLIHYDDPLEFMRYQAESVKLKEKIGDSAGLVDSYFFISRMYGYHGNFRRAYAFTSRALDLSARIGYELGRGDAEYQMAIMSVWFGDYDRAIALNRRLLERDRGNPAMFSVRLGILVAAFLGKGDGARVLEVFNDPRWPLGNPGSSQAGRFLGRAEAYTLLGDWAEAQENLEMGEKVARQEGPSLWWNMLPHKMAIARILERVGRPDEALLHLLEAAELEAALFTVPADSLGPGQNRDLYDRLFSLLLDRNSSVNAETIFRLLEQLRYRALRNVVVKLSDAPKRIESERERQALARIEAARSTGRADIDHLRRAYAEYEDLLLRARLQEPRYRLVHRARPVSSQEVRRYLDPGTALVEFIVAGDRLFALVITNKELRSVALPITATALAVKLKLLRKLVFEAEAGEQTDWLPVAQDLRGRLIDPLGLAGIQRLGLIPYGPLHEVPFAALARIENGRPRFLVEDYVLFQVPSATFFAYARNRSLAPSRRAIAFGSNGSDDEGLSPLKYAAEEARAVAGILKGQLRLNGDASETTFKNSAARFQIIHVATHGLSEPMFPLWSRLKLPATSTDDGNLTIREILDLGLDADLVTLSGCRTGHSSPSSGDDRSEVDRLGLIEAFLNAGARSVLASPLPVEDRATTEFMRRFYRNLQQTDKAAALAATQRVMLRGEISPAFTHPRYWAPFILVGDPR